MTSGRINDVGQYMSRILKDEASIRQEHVALSIDAVTGEVEPYNDPTLDLRVYGVTVRSTKSRIEQSIANEVFLTGKERGGEAIAVMRSGMCDVALDIDHGLIQFNSPMRCSGNAGFVKLGNVNGAKQHKTLVGFAEESIAGPALGTRTKATVRVSLALQNGSTF